MLLAIYRALTRVLHWFLYPVGWWRARGGSLQWKHRLGMPGAAAEADLWIHASSVGEVRVIEHLVRHTVKRREGLRWHVTCMTSTGYATAEILMGDSATIGYLPLDTPQAVRRMLGHVEPRLLVLAETEIWPNLIFEARRAGIAVVLVNGRMTERAFRRYRMISSLMRAVLAVYDRMFLKTDEDARHYIALGADSGRVQVVGDMKFDAPLADSSPERVKALRNSWRLDSGGFVFVAGSTRPGEESLLLDAFEDLRRKIQDLQLVLVPRHIERVPEILAMIRQRGLTCSLLDQEKPPGGLSVVDRMGVLGELYVAADLAFVGGTLVDIGGHNLLEPVWAGTPVLFGPYLGNVVEAADYIMAHDLGARVADVSTLARVTEEVAAGRKVFAKKRNQDEAASPSVIAGDYILKKMQDG